MVFKQGLNTHSHLETLFYHGPVTEILFQQIRLICIEAAIIPEHIFSKTRFN